MEFGQGYPTPSTSHLELSRVVRLVSITIYQDIPCLKCTVGTGQKAFLWSKQQSPVFKTRRVKATGGCCLRVASWRACAKASKDGLVTGKYTRRHQPLRSPWASQRRAVGEASPCQSSTSQQVHLQLTSVLNLLKWSHEKLVQLLYNDTRIHSVWMSNLWSGVCEIAAGHGNKPEPS